GVGGEEGVSGAAAKDNDAAFLHVAHCTPADIGFGDFDDTHCRHHARWDAHVLERVLEHESIDDRCEHADGVRRGALHVAGGLAAAAENIPAADDHAYLDAKVMNGFYFFGDEQNGGAIETEGFLSLHH